MGSGTRIARCERFINEFSDDYVAKHHTSLALPEDQRLDIDHDDEIVRLFVLDDAGCTFMSRDIVFYPESDDELVVEEVAVMLDIEEAEALNRLVRSDLVEE